MLPPLWHVCAAGVCGASWFYSLHVMTARHVIDTSDVLRHALTLLSCLCFTWAFLAAFSKYVSARCTEDACEACGLPEVINKQQTQEHHNTISHLPNYDGEYPDGTTYKFSVLVDLDIRDKHHERASLYQSSESRPSEYHPRPVEQYPNPVEGYPRPVVWYSRLLEQYLRPMEGHPMPAEGHPRTVEDHPSPTEYYPWPTEQYSRPKEGQPRPFKGNPGPKKGHLRSMEGHSRPAEVHPRPAEGHIRLMDPRTTECHSCLLEGHPKLAQGHPRLMEHHPSTVEQHPSPAERPRPKEGQPRPTKQYLRPTEGNTRPEEGHPRPVEQSPRPAEVHPTLAERCVAAAQIVLIFLGVRALKQIAHFYLYYRLLFSQADLLVAVHLPLYVCVIEVSLAVVYLLEANIVNQMPRPEDTQLVSVVGS